MWWSELCSHLVSRSHGVLSIETWHAERLEHLRATDFRTQDCCCMKDMCPYLWSRHQLEAFQLMERVHFYRWGNWGARNCTRQHTATAQPDGLDANLGLTLEARPFWKQHITGLNASLQTLNTAPSQAGVSPSLLKLFLNNFTEIQFMSNKLLSCTYLRYLIQWGLADYTPVKEPHRYRTHFPHPESLCAPFSSHTCLRPVP